MNNCDLCGCDVETTCRCYEKYLFERIEKLETQVKELQAMIKINSIITKELFNELFNKIK